MDYAIVSTAVADHIRLSSGEDIGFRLGGAGIYAWSGIRLWTDSCRLITGVGEDFSALFGDWMRKSGADVSGLIAKDAHTAISNIQYFEDGERIETPEYGLAHYTALEATADEIARYAEGVKGVYLFKDLPEVFWNRLLEHKRKLGFRLMWEINADAARAERYEEVLRRAEECDVFSINRTEAMSLFDTTSEQRAIGNLVRWGLPMVYLRRGARGAVVITPRGVEEIPSVPVEQVIDPTGAGNSASGAVLYGFCEGMTPYECGLLGSISASYCIRQYGPPAIDHALMAQAKQRLEQMKREYDNAQKR
ncbi:MAG: carbohydrate kinase family protein [Eubacteriales bacterium]|nr:carbohydrate kinase family protein [Eubacteriales bacterium]